MIKQHQLGLTLGIVFGLLHLVLSVANAVIPSSLQSFVNWIVGLHGFSVPVTVVPVTFANAVILVIFTSLIGYILGTVITVIWNNVMKMVK